MFGDRQLPRIDVEAIKDLTDKERQVVTLIVATRGEQKGHLRASKPAVDKANPLTGLAAYVWRMVAFQVSPITQHQCMPITADFDLPESEIAQIEDDHRYGARAKLAKQWDVTVEKVVNTIPKSQWYGISRWGRALGYDNVPDLNG